MILLACGCLLAGMLLGFTAAVRLSPRLLARLDPAERLEFARKVNAAARR